MQKDYWFKDGLKFSCQGCGKCCKGPGGYVWLNDEEALGFADKLNITKEQFYKKFIRLAYGKLSLIDNMQGDCIFMNDDGKCKHYEQRPQQCRTFPWWPEILVDKETWDSNLYNCPGIGIGRLFSQEEIIKELEDQ